MFDDVCCVLSGLIISVFWGMQSWNLSTCALGFWEALKMNSFISFEFENGLSREALFKATLKNDHKTTAQFSRRRAFVWH